MGNMSYCRFENTLADMRDCLNALENGLDVEELSSYEACALSNFADVARQIARFEGNIANVIEEFESVNG